MARGFGLTPEILLSGLRRNDSKNPHTTCFGITNSGRPCRRSLTAAMKALNSDRGDDEQSSVVAVVEENEIGSEITAFFCWQHKDQADSYHGSRARKVELRTRSSLEDMLSEMGLEDTRHVAAALRRPSRTAKQTMHAQMQEPHAHVAQSPTNPMADTGFPRRQPNLHRKEKEGHQVSQQSQVSRANQARRKTRREPSAWDAICACFGTNENLSDHDQPVKVRRRSSIHHSQVTSRQRDHKSHSQSLTHTRNDSKFSNRARSPSGTERLEFITHQAQKSENSSESKRGPRHSGAKSSRPDIQESYSQPVVPRKPLTQRPADRNKRWQSAADPIATTSTDSAGVMTAASLVIPQDASLMLASNLMAEMSKVNEDSREGYIYIYWLDDAPGNSADDAGISLLAPSPQRHRNVPTSQNKVLLKIGRAENVHGRLSQWQRQCGYKPLLVRAYPGAEDGSKVQHLHRVERLIHLELADKNVKKQCTACSKEHREWFEVDGRDGVREVDRIVRKWVEWSARQPVK